MAENSIRQSININEDNVAPEYFDEERKEKRGVLLEIFQASGHSIPVLVAHINNPGRNWYRNIEACFKYYGVIPAEEREKINGKITQQSLADAQGVTDTAIGLKIRLAYRVLTRLDRIHREA